MNKSISTAALLVIAAFTNIQAQDFNPKPFPDRVILTWKGNSDVSQTVTWRTDTTIVGAKAQIKAEDSSPALEEAITAYDADSRLLSGGQNYATAKYHSVTFNNLKPGTVYAYRVGAGEYWSEWFQFTTASANQNKP